MQPHANFKWSPKRFPQQRDKDWDYQPAVMDEFHSEFPNETPQPAKCGNETPQSAAVKDAEKAACPNIWEVDLRKVVHEHCFRACLSFILCKS